MSTQLNAAVKANLQRVIDEERATTVTRIAGIRVTAAVLATLVMLSQLGEARTRPSLYGAITFLGIAIGILVALKARPQLAGALAYATPLLDTPLLAAIQFQQQRLLDQPWWGIPNNVAFMMALIASAALTLSRPAVVLTAAVAIVSNQLTFARTGIPLPVRFLATIPPVMIAIIGITLMERLTRVARAARRRDLLGKYVLGQRLGAGGMAEVFEATYSPEGGFERRVALKRILPSIAESAEAVALFRREAELGARLAHPNIVQVLDFGADGETYFMALEYVDGTTLSRLLTHLRAHQKTLPVPVVVYLAVQLAEALAYVHERASPTGSKQGLVHRDLNPPNIMLSRLGEVKLADFGIARALDQPGLTKTGMIRGKLGYSAPEQLKGEPYDARADLFSLGVTLFESLSGRRLFSGDSDLSVMKASLEQPIPHLSQERSDVPLPLDEAIRGLLERDLSRRTASAELLREQLARLPSWFRELREAQRQLAELVTEVRAVVATPAQSPDSGAGPSMSAPRPAADVPTKETAQPP